MGSGAAHQRAWRPDVSTPDLALSRSRGIFKWVETSSDIAPSLLMHNDKVDHGRHYKKTLGLSDGAAQNLL